MRPELRGRLKLGLGINNSKLCGCILVDVLDYNEYLSKFAPLWPQACALPARACLQEPACMVCSMLMRR